MTPPETADDVLKAQNPPAHRESFVWNGVTIERRFAQRPRVQRLEVSHARGCGVGENQISFQEGA